MFCASPNFSLDASIRTLVKQFAAIRSAGIRTLERGRNAQVDVPESSPTHMPRQEAATSVLLPAMTRLRPGQPARSLRSSPVALSWLLVWRRSAAWSAGIEHAADDRLRRGQRRGCHGTAGRSRVKQHDSNAR